MFVPKTPEAADEQDKSMCVCHAMSVYHSVYSERALHGLWGVFVRVVIEKRKLVTP